MSSTLSRRDFLKISASAIAAAGLAGYGGRWLQNRLTESSVQPPAEARNVILVVLDTVRASNLSLFGYELPTTPNLSRLAQSAVHFTNAISPASWTLQAHSSIFTGRLPFKLTADWSKPLDATYPTLAEAYREAGYDTAGFIANYYYLGREYGLDRGFQHYESYRLTPGRAFASTSLGVVFYRRKRLFRPIETNENFGYKNASHVRQEFIDWLERRDSQRPFFAFLNFIDAHEPYLPPKEFVSRLTNTLPIGHFPEDSKYYEDPGIIQGLMAAYDGAIAYVDDQVNQLIEQLRARGLLENSVVVITSDHGEHFGDHGLLDHGNSMYRTLLHVPLLLLNPGTQPATINQTVGLRDLATTFVELSGIQTPYQFPGQSLSRFWTQPNAPAQIVRSESHIHSFNDSNTAGWGLAGSLTNDRFHYIRYEDDREELFNLVDDPAEKENLVGSNGVKSDLETFRQLMGDKFPISPGVEEP